VNQADIVEQKELEERIIDEVVLKYKNRTFKELGIVISAKLISEYIKVVDRNNKMREEEWKNEQATESKK